MRILAKNCGAKLRLRLGESMSEAYSELGEHGSTNDHALRDGEFFVPDLSDQTYFDSGFRYLRIDAVEKDVTLKAVVAVSKRVGYERVGSFRHADERLTRIFDVAADTVTLCMRGGMLWDGIKRDRLVWIGDHVPGVSGRHGVVPRNGLPRAVRRLRARNHAAARVDEHHAVVFAVVDYFAVRVFSPALATKQRLRVISITWRGLPSFTTAL